jgi:hypothetical protein
MNGLCLLQFDGVSTNRGGEMPWPNLGGSSSSRFRAQKVMRFPPTCSRRGEELVLHTDGEGNG